MPNNDAFQNAPHLAPRLAVPLRDRDYGPPAPGIPERTAAIRIEELLAAGNTGGVVHLVREIENGIGTWKDASPWRLLEHLLDRGLIRPAEAPAGDAPATAPAPGQAPGADTA